MVAARFLLDTNVLSETMQRRPEPRVIDWLEAQEPETVFLPAMALGELAKGAYAAKDPAKQRNLVRWVLVDVVTKFKGRIIPFEADAALIWGEIAGRAYREGRRLAEIDGQMAAIALLHGMIMVTRNISHFDVAGLQVANPWDVLA
jgi:predicted nucleic acid-binding protein